MNVSDQMMAAPLQMKQKNSYWLVASQKSLYNNNM